MMATTGFDGNVRIYDPRSGERLCVLRGHKSYVLSLAFSPDGRQLVSGANDTTARIWDVTEARELLVLRGHTVGEARGVYDVTYDRDGRRVATSSADRTIKIWDTHSAAAFRSREKKESSGSPSVPPSDDDRFVAHRDPSLEFTTLEGHTNVVLRISFSPNSERIASASLDGSVKIFDVRTAQEILSFDGHDRSVTSVAYSPDGRCVASGTGSLDDKPGKILVWKADSGEVVGRFEGHKGPISALRFFPDGTRLVSTSGNMAAGTHGEVKVWDVESGEELVDLAGIKGAVAGVAVSPDGQMITTCGFGGIRLWDATSGQHIRDIGDDNIPFFAVAFGPDGTTLAAGGPDRSVRMWNVATWQQTWKVVGHPDTVSSVAFTPDGRRLVSSSEGGTVKVWETTTGHALLTFRAHCLGCFNAAFSPDGQLLASAEFDGTITIRAAKHETTVQPDDSSDDPREDSLDELTRRFSEAMRANRLDVAIDTATKAMEVDPGKTMQWLWWRAGMYARSRRWNNAGEDYGRLVSLLSALSVNLSASSQSTLPWVLAAQIALKQGHPEQYKQICREAYAKFVELRSMPIRPGDLSLDEATAYHNLAVICLLLPDTLDATQKAKLLQIFEGLDKGKNFEKAGYLHRSHGLTLYRQGDFEGALRVVSVKLGDPANSANLDLIRAMALARVGRSDEAKSVLEAARRKLDRNGPESNAKHLPLNWPVWLHSSLLFTEAEKTVRAHDSQSESIKGPTTSTDDGQRKTPRASGDSLHRLEGQGETTAIKKRCAENVVAGKWDEVAADCQYLVNLDPKSENWEALVVAHLQANNIEGYRETCQKAFERFSEDHIIIWARALLIQLCALAPDAGVDTDKLTSLSEGILKEKEKDIPFMKLAAGMNDYRCGRFEQAIARLPDKGDARLLAMLFRAMAHRQLGQVQQATEQLERGLQQIEQHVPTVEGPPLADYMPDRWVVWATLDIVRREAEELIENRPKEKDQPK